jgi:hypothetical protein
VTTPIGTAANPLHVQGTAVGGDVNIAQYGGVATSLGQKANAASIPIVISSEQVPEVQDLDLTPMGEVPHIRISRRVFNTS